MSTPSKVDYNALRKELKKSTPVKGSSVSVNHSDAADGKNDDANFQSPSKKRKLEYRKRMINIQTVVKSAPREKFDEWLIVKFVELQDDFVKDPRVRNYRRRIVVADKSATCAGFIKTDKISSQIASGDTVEMSKFKYNRRDKALVIHSGTLVGK